MFTQGSMCTRAENATEVVVILNRETETHAKEDIVRSCVVS